MPTYLPFIPDREYALLRSVSTATKRAWREEEENGSEARSTIDSSNGRGTTGLSSIPLQSLHARLPSRPNLSTSACSPIAARSPIVRSPNRRISAFTSVDMGSRSMEWGARKARASSGTLVAPCVLHVRAAMKAGNLVSATPTRGVKYADTEFSRAETTPASPRYSLSRPSSRA